MRCWRICEPPPSSIKVGNSRWKNYVSVRIAEEAAMTDQKLAPKTAKQAWATPVLVRLGTVADIAGPRGSGFQAGPNSRS